MVLTEIKSTEQIIQEYNNYIEDRDFPCIAAKAALSKNKVNAMVADHISCPKDDKAILDFIYNFVDEYRKSTDLYHSVAIIFREPEVTTEEEFDQSMWRRLQKLSDLDQQYYSYDHRVDSHPDSENFSFSLKEEAFFIIGLHPGSSRTSRRFAYPTLTFNPHAQFEKLKATGKYQHMKSAVRKRDFAVSGSVNPMLEDFGASSEVYQYSGRIYDKNWECPFKRNEN